MRLNAKILKNVENVNNWEYTNQAYVQEGQSNQVYIQLVDWDKTLTPEENTALPEYPLRYMPQSGAGAEAIFPSIDDDDEITVTGVQPFTEDTSIWRFDLNASQTPKSGSFRIRLTEGGVVRQFLVRAGLSVETIEVGGC